MKENVLGFLRRFRQKALNDKKRVGIALIGGVAILTCFAFLFFIFPPADAPESFVVKVEQGESLIALSERLSQKNVIRSPLALRGILRLTGGDTRVVAGDYYFERAPDVVTFALRLSRGDFGIEVFRVVIPEGSSRKQIAQTISSIAPDFDQTEFMLITSEEEGYLFPDTYFFSALISPEEAARRMRANFNRQIEILLPRIEESGRSLPDILAMASMLELETKDPKDRRIISGILWKRLDESMPLQVDATFRYINGKGTFELTESDLRSDSPYNTYRYGGLPPTPIGNPGLDAIEAAITPTPSEYWYFLSDRDGTMHYSETFEEHVEKKREYLN